MSQPLLLPTPRQLTLTGAVHQLPATALIAITAPDLLFEAQSIQSALQSHADRAWEIVVGPSLPHVGLSLHLDSSYPHPQGYHLQITETAITVRAHDSAGIFYAVTTLRQLLQQHQAALPTLTIDDWPDFPARGVMLDISRDKVPTLQTVLDLVDRLASWKINQLQLYMEHTFAYRNHPVVWAEATPFTGQDILILDAYCRQRHIELVPNQNSLGHMERWLKHDQYHHLAECPDGFEPPWGGHMAATTLNPLDPGSLSLITSLYDELLPHFTSPNFNVGGDEPWELGKGKSKAEVEARGGRVYLDYIRQLHQAVTAHGRKMQFWGDIIVHYPDLVPELPPDVTAMLWGYEGGEKAAAEWERQTTLLQQSGIPFYVCPGTSSWNSIIGRTDNAIDNCRIAARSGIQHDAVGYLITDWGDAGHWQPLAISYTGFAYGAGVAWCLATNEQRDLPRTLNAFAFDDPSGIMGQLAVDLGDIYQIIGPEHINGQVLAYALQITPTNMETELSRLQEWGGGEPDISPQALQTVLARLDQVMQPLAQSTTTRPDAAVLRAEFQQAAALTKHSSRRLLNLYAERVTTNQEQLADLQTLLEAQQTVWLARNRAGGLQDSLRRFDNLIAEYTR